MGLREFGKMKGTSGDNINTMTNIKKTDESPLFSIINTGVNLSAKVKKIFEK
jgi:hypothetical protein